MSLRDHEIKNEYRSLVHNVVQDFYVPLLREAVSYKRAVGFFSSSALAELTNGITGLIRNNGKISLIASPYLSEEDLTAIREGYREREEVIEACLLKTLKKPVNLYEEERLNLLSNLIATEVLDIKIAFLETENEIGMYHEKMGLITDEANNIVAFTGSMNESANAFLHNYESIDVFCSWTNDMERVTSKKASFEALWNNIEPNVRTIEFPKINTEIMNRYQKNNCIDLELDQRQFGIHRKPAASMPGFIRIPTGVRLKDYQMNAINEWENQEFQGIYDMATGTGKTFTALGSLERLEKVRGNAAVFIVCTYIHLVNQWEEDVFQWGVTPIIAHSQAENKKWDQKLIAAYKRFRSTGKPFMCITTNVTFCDEKIQYVIRNITIDMNCVLVIDEMHNFGASHLSRFLPENFQYRLGLSATVERYMDRDGTDKIVNYFGQKCIEYPIERAIKEKALVEYEYHPIMLSLRDDELEEYQRLTAQITKYLINDNGKITVSESGKQLLFKRSRLIAGAEDKLDMLRKQLLGYKNHKHILVYCGATRGFEQYPGQKERQIDRVERIIGRELEMTTHRFTSEENMSTRKLLKEGFADGEYQVLTAIKCLDEGVNIPNIQTAFILASSRNPKEFIQRRGRVLRRAEGKDRAVIYDFITLPRRLRDVRFGDFENDRALVIGEMARIYEFGRYSINSRKADKVLEEIKEAYNVDILNEDLDGMMEAYYGEE